MLFRLGVVALLAAALSVGAVSQAGAAADGIEGIEKASDTDSEVQQRVGERRRERRGLREWIDVPKLSPAEALPLVGSTGVVVIDVTCRRVGADVAARIPGAVWQDCTQVEQWFHTYEEAKAILVYCA